MAEEGEAEVKELRATVELGEKIQKLLLTDGWHLIEAWIKDEINREFTKFKNIKKDDRFYKIQGKIKALEEVLEKPREMVDEKAWAEERLQEIGG